MSQLSTILRGALSIGGLALLAVVAYQNVHDLGSIEGYASPQCLMMYALAAGTALAAHAIPNVWRTARVTAVLIGLGTICGEAYGLYTTAERLLSARDLRASHVAHANGPRAIAEQAVKAATAELEKAKAEAAKARTDRSCGGVCKAWDAEADRARKRLAEANSALVGTRASLDASPLATALGISERAANIIPTLLGSVAVTLLGFGLMVAGGHAPKAPAPEPAKPRTRAKQTPKARKQAHIARIREMTKANGGKPPAFKVIRDELDLPKSTAHRYRKAAMQ